MNIKKIVFSVMCAILAIMIVIFGITIGKAGILVQSVLTPAPPATNPATKPTDDPSDVTDPPETNGPTSGTTDSSHEHTYSKLQTYPATCTEEGYSLYKCSCGDVKTDDIVAVLGHSYGIGKVVTACTGEDVCYTEYACSRCDHVDKRDIKDGTGHKFDIEEEIPASCEHDACIIRKCSNPNCTETETEFITGTSLGGHDFSIFLEEVGATCSTDGYKLYRCANKDCTAESKIENGKALGHDFAEWSESGDGMQTTCKNPGCSVSVHSSELEITNAYQSESSYIIIVGTSTDSTDLHRIYSYTIIDNRSESDKETNKLSYSLDPKSGLIVEYIDALGSEQKAVLGFKDSNLTIE